MSTLKETLAKYTAEINEDIHLDRVNVTDMVLKVPGIKHKWVARLMNHKADVLELIEARETAITNLIKKIKAESPVTINDLLASREAEKHELITKVDKEMRDQRNIIEYLEKVEKLMDKITFDIKNLTELNKQETM